MRLIKNTEKESVHNHKNQETVTLHPTAQQHYYAVQGHSGFSAVKKTMYLIIRLVAWSVWAVVGLFLWVPFLFRSIITFNGSMIYGTATQNPYILSQARNTLDYATIFYIAGFRNIEQWSRYDCIMEPAEPDQSGQPFFRRFLLDLIWTAFWWAGFAYMIGLIPGEIG